jgi:hypothetical protein
MDTKCKYYIFNIMIWVFVLAGVFCISVNWLEIIPNNTIRTIVALIIVLPGGSLFHKFFFTRLGQAVIEQAEKAESDFDQKISGGPYIFADAFGIFERSFYLILLLVGKPEALFLWLGFKAIVKWGQPENTREWKFSKPFNFSLIRELTNIFLALAGILIIKGNLNSLLSLFSCSPLW